MDWKAQNRIEQAYARELKALVSQFESDIKNIDNPNEIVKILKHISNSEIFRRQCENTAYKMVTMLEKKERGTWRQAALEGSKGREIYNALMKELRSGAIGSIVNERIVSNAGMIKTLPNNLAVEFAGHIQREVYGGRRASDIADDLRKKLSETSKANITLIARTEASRTQCTLTQARAENLGLNWYIWRTSKDGRVRSSHSNMDGVLVKWGEPPNPEKLNGTKGGQNYHAGMIYNCRCYAEPVIDISLVGFPRKVYRNGEIRSVTEAQFLQI